MLDVTEVFTALDVVSVPSTTVLSCPAIHILQFKLSAKNRSGTLQGILSNGHFVTSIFTGSDKVGNGTC